MLQNGHLCLSPPAPPAAAGITLLQGTSSTSLQQLLQHSSSNVSSNASSYCSTDTTTTPPQHPAPQQQQQLMQFPELSNALFGQLPGALLPEYLDNAELSLVHVALVQLTEGGTVLGLRMSHLMGDWSSARLLLQSIAAAYSQIQATANAAVTDSSKGSSSAELLPHAAQVFTPAAPLLNKLVAAARQQLPTNFEPVRLKLQQPADAALFEKLAQLSNSSCESHTVTSDSLGDISSSSSGQPQRITYHVLPHRIQQLKHQALADIAAATRSNADADSSRACTSHNVLLARLLQAFGSLPGRSGAPHDVAVSVDMRGKLPLQQQQQEALSVQEQQQLSTAFGNLFASAILEDAVPETCSLGELVMQLRAAVDRWVTALAHEEIE
jgi:hypothetical protein